MLKEPKIRGRKNSHNQKIWRAHVDACQKSGLSRAEYCRQHNLSHHALRYWQKKYERVGQAEMAFVPVPFAGIVKKPVRQEWSSVLKVEVGNRFRIEVSDEFSAATLVRLITTLEGC